MAVETPRATNPARQAFGWLSRMGLAAPLIAGAVLVALVLMTLASPLYEAPSEVNAGSVENYVIGDPEIFKEEDIWLVRISQTEFVAIYDKDPVSGCALVWAPSFEHMGRTGWFRDVCTGSVYDLTGACFSDRCGIGLNTYDLKIENGEVVIDARRGTRGALAEENAEPVNPPQ